MNLCTYLELTKKNQKITTCNQLDLETMGFWHIVSNKKIPKHYYHVQSEIGDVEMITKFYPHVFFFFFNSFRRQKAKKPTPNSSRTKRRCTHLMGRQSSLNVSQHHIKSNKAPSNKNAAKDNLHPHQEATDGSMSLKRKKKKGYSQKKQKPINHHHPPFTCLTLCDPYSMTHGWW